MASMILAMVVVVVVVSEETVIGRMVVVCRREEIEEKKTERVPRRFSRLTGGRFLNNGSGGGRFKMSPRWRRRRNEAKKEDIGGEEKGAC